MADDTAKSIVERLKSEGQLIRNTGTNSIKSVRTDLARFGDLFESINTNIMLQTQLLRDTLDLQLSLDQKNERDRQLSDAARSNINSNTTTSTRGSAKSSGSAQSESSGLLSLLGTAGIAGGAIFAAMKNPIKLALLSVIAPAIGSLLGEFTSAALLEVGTDPGNAKSFGEAAGMTGLWGTIGLAFGKRAGLAGAAGGAAYSFGDEVLDSLGIDKKQLVTIAGKEMQIETLVSGTLGALGGALAFTLTSPGFWSGAMSLAQSSAEFIGKKNAISLAAAGAVIGLYLNYGDEAKSWLADQGMPSGFADMGVDTLAFAATGASLGGMFGPTGMIAGAALGFAVGLGKAIVDWMTSTRDEATVQFRKDVDGVKDILDRAKAGEEISKEDMKKLSEVRGEANRRTSLSLPKEEIDYATNVLGNINDTTGAQPLNKNGIGQNQIQDRISKALGGSDQALQDLVSYLKGQGYTNNSDIFETLYGMGVESFYRSKTLSPAETNQLTNKWEDLLNTAMDNNFNPITQTQIPTGFSITNGANKVLSTTPSNNQFLNDNVNKNWLPILNKVQEVAAASVSTGTSSITYSPVTIAPTTMNNVQGGSSTVTMGISGGSRSDLDLLSAPRGAH